MLRRRLTYLCIFVLFFVPFLQPVITVKANNKIPHYNPKLKILEIVDIDSQDSRIKNALGTESFEFETITMKKFVASRNELNGKYDFIAITDGEYSAANASDLIRKYGQTKAHETQNVQNDITELKANEIIVEFIEKGQPVILEKKSIDNNGNLEQFFTRYNGSNKNVIFYNGNGNSNQQDLVAHVKNFLNGKNYKPRPRFHLAYKPSEYKSGSQKYQPGNQLRFDIEMLSTIQNKDLRAILYIDADFDDKYDPSEMVVDKQITNRNESITYELPTGYSGIRNWKLEVIDLGTNLKEYQKGTIFFKDQMVEVDVLQIQKASGDNSSLKESVNMNQSYLYVPGEYKINIDVTDMATFNKNAAQSPKYSHQVINGKYDMLIFGFADVYNNTAINLNAVNSVEKFIQTNQSILFTHDTIFNNNNNWVNNFMDDTAQIEPQTNLGYGAPKQSTQTKKVNDGLMTTYPYELDENIRIATTHNQYYTLDLEDPKVIPWYNITGGERDEYDSWNHYYTYSRGNITYSGTGHTSTRFPEEEQKLFVNTMYRAFLGSNHAPVLTVNTPIDGDIIPSHQKIELSYKIQDFDLKDKKIATKVFLNDKEVFSQNDITNGSTIVQSIDHGMLDGGDASLRIEAIDMNGAKSEKTIQLKIEKIQANLQVSRTVSANEIVPVNEPVTINFAINPKDLQGATIKNVSSDYIDLENITYSETFPANLDVVVPSGFEKTGSLAKGYKVTANLENIRYHRNGNKFTAQPMNFSITIVPKVKNQFTLNSSTITYKDISTKTETVIFNPVTLRSDIAIERIELPESIVLNKGIPKNLSLDLKILPESAGIKDIIWSVTSGVNVIQIDPQTGVATALTEGEAYIKVKVTDVFGNVQEATTYVTVRVPVEEIRLDDITVKVGEVKSLPLTVKPADAISSLTIQLGDPSLAAINKANMKVEGLKPGRTSITVTGINKDGEEITDIATLTIEEILVEKITVTPDIVHLDKFEKFSNFNITIEPSDATNKNLNWQSLNPSIVQIVEDGKIRGMSTGKAEVEISSEDGNARTTITVYVGSPLTGVSTNPSQITIEKGDNSKNIKSYLIYHPSDATNIGDVQYVSSNEYVAQINPNGNILANRLGEADIQITVFDEEGKSYQATLNVTVVDPGTSGGNDNDKW